MANVANVTPSFSVPNAANVYPVPCVLDTGPANINTGAAQFRTPTAQPSTGSGTVIPKGPQVWPI